MNQQSQNKNEYLDELTCHSKVQELRGQLHELHNKTNLNQFDETLSNQYANELKKYEILLEKHEILLKENPDRFVMFPLTRPDIWQFYKMAMASFWTAEEISLLDDIDQWKKGEKGKLSEDDKFFIKHILAFFASFDGIVNENLALRFYSEVQLPEARSFYGFQIAMENIHGEVYSLLIDTLVESSSEKEKLFKAVENYPSIKKLADWALKWLNSDLPFNQRLIAFACVEGILFSGAFCSIFWVKKRGLLPGLTFSNELISKDESLHMDFACSLNQMLKYPATNETITEIVKDAVEIEKEFINESLPCNLIGMNANEMSKYIEFVSDRLLLKLGCDKYWKTQNPFEWMDLISAPNLTNFFEKKVGEYNKSKFNKSTINNTRDASSALDSNHIKLLSEF